MQMNSIQVRLLRSVKEELARFKYDAELKRYEKSWEKHFHKAWVKSSAKKLRHAVKKSEVLILGDFHGYDQSQRTHLRLLRALPLERQTCLILECFKPEHDGAIKSWLKGSITDSKLLERTNWVKSWGFSWQNYRPLLELARARGWTVVGLSRLDNTLKARDQAAAARIAELKKEHKKVIAIIGDFHLGPQALNKCLKQYRPDVFRKTVFVHQNAQALYQRSVKRVSSGMVDVYSLGKNEYCIINSAPWVKWTSHLAFTGAEGSRLDEEPFLDVITTIGKSWATQLNISWDHTEWDIYTWNSKEKLIKDLKRNRIALELVRKEIGFVDPSLRFIYLPRPSLNMGSQLIAQTIWYTQNLNAKPAKSFTSHTFAYQLFIEMFGFCFSKCFNPYRPPRTLLDMARETVSDPLAKEGYFVCKEFSRSPLRVLSRARLTSGEFYAARRLGSFLGEIWWRQRSIRDRSEHSVLQFFRQDWTVEKWRNFILRLWKLSHSFRLESKGERL